MAKSQNSDELVIERLGGFAGFGGPGGHIKSTGKVSISRLNPDDSSLIERLFTKALPAFSPKPDEFRYRLTRKMGNEVLSIEIPEGQVPQSIKDAVKDTID